MKISDLTNVLVACAFAAGIVSCGGSQAKVYIIDSNSSITRLDSSLISDHDEIYFMPGVYDLAKPIKIDRSHVTIGAHPGKRSKDYACPVLRKSDAFVAIRISGDNNKLTCLTIDGNEQGGAGIAVYGSNNVLSQLVSINNKGAGILFHGEGPVGNGRCKNNVVKNAAIFNNGKVGLSQYNCQGNQISNSEIRENRLEGITIDVGSHRTTVDRSTIQYNRGGVAGIGIDHSNDVRLTHNKIIGNKKGGLRTQNNVGPSDNLNVSCNSFDNPNYDIWLRNNTCEGESRSNCEKWSHITPVNALHNAPNAIFRYNEFAGQGVKVDMPSDLRQNIVDGAADTRSFCSAH